MDNFYCVKGNTWCIDTGATLMCVGTGQRLWEYEVHQGTVLYLALEDLWLRQSKSLLTVSLETPNASTISLTDRFPRSSKSVNIFSNRCS